MANLMNYKNNRHIGDSGGLGQKVKNLVKLAGTVKDLYTVGRTAYAVGEAVAPYILPVLGAL